VLVIDADESAAGAGVQTCFILNRVDDDVLDALTAGLAPQRIIAAIPRDNEIFLQNLRGQPLTAVMPQMKAACAFITSYHKPLSMNMQL
jgi:CO dehydrogenase maturation factor